MESVRATLPRRSPLSSLTGARSPDDLDPRALPGLFGASLAFLREALEPRGYLLYKVRLWVGNATSLEGR